MKIRLKRKMTENQKVRIEAQLAEIEAQEAQTMLEPIERPDDTFMVVNLKAKKGRLLDELAQCERALTLTEALPC